MKKRNATPKIDRFAVSNFASNPLDLGWESMYESLIEYRENFGHCDVPKTYQTNNGLNLGNWVNRQMIEHAMGKLDLRKIKRLKEIGLEV